MSTGRTFAPAEIAPHPARRKSAPEPPPRQGTGDLSRRLAFASGTIVLRAHADGGTEVDARWLRTGLRVGSPRDPLEHEAERIAERVMHAPPRIGKGRDGPVTAMEPEPAGEDRSTEAREVIAPSAGSPLDAGTKAFMEDRFGLNFGRVRVHTDASASKAARSLGARAFTLGHDVVFAAGSYAPGSAGGRRLLAHELAHVVQQRSVRASAGTARTVLQRQVDAGVPEAPVQDAGAGPIAGLAEGTDPEAERVARLQASYEAAVMAADWEQAAVHLNGFNDTDILSRLRKLSSGQRARMMEGALKAMPTWHGRITKPIARIDPEATRSGMEREVKRLATAGKHDQALELICDTYGFSGPNFEIKVVEDIKGAWATTSGEIKEGAKQTLKIRKNLFDENLPFIVRTIGHEFQHLRQRSQKDPITNQKEREFLAWAWEALDPSVPQYSLTVAAEHADKALEYYDDMPEERKRVHAGRKTELEQLIARAAKAP